MAFKLKISVMKKYICLSLLLSTVSFSVFSQAKFDYSFIDPKDPEVCQLIPKNTHSSSTGRGSSASKSKKSFMDTIEFVQQGMDPVIKAAGIKLTWNIDWNTKVENAFASSQGGKNRTLTIYGELYRNPLITPDSFSFVLCHELGHVLAGAPFSAKVPVLSAEGQADYYAANVCLPLVFQGQNNIEAIRRLNVPIRIKNRCDSKWRVKEDSAICQRTIMAGLSVFTWIAESSGIDHLDLLQRDRSSSNETITYGYPEVQCRLDTAMAGAYCNKGPTSTSRIGAPSNCSARQFINRDGARPECWFTK
jgi:hypothetical protein